MVLVPAKGAGYVKVAVSTYFKGVDFVPCACHDPLGSLRDRCEVLFHGVRSRHRVDLLSRLSCLRSRDSIATSLHTIPGSLHVPLEECGLCWFCRSLRSLGCGLRDSGYENGEPLVCHGSGIRPAQLFNFIFTWWFQGLKRWPNAWFNISLIGVMFFSWAVQQFKGGTAITDLSFEPGIWLLFTLLAALCWGLYGVSARISVMTSAKASNGHGSHFKPLLVICCVYFLFGLGTWILGTMGLVGEISLERLKANPEGLIFGLLTGVLGLGGAAFVIFAVSHESSPGPIVVMALVFLGAAAVNALGTPLWEKLYLEKAISQPWYFWASLAFLALCGFGISYNNPNKPPKKRAAS